MHSLRAYRFYSGLRQTNGNGRTQAAGAISQQRVLVSARNLAAELPFEVPLAKTDTPVVAGHAEPSRRKDILITGLPRAKTRRPCASPLRIFKSVTTRGARIV